MTLRSPQRLVVYFLSGSVLVFALLLAAWVRDARRPWKPYQRAYIQAERARAETPAAQRAAANLRVGIRQVLVPALDRVDRCTSCHLAVDNPDCAEGEQPLRTHPHHTRHAFDEFGCTVCHRGNGLATSADAAHGLTPSSSSPMLPTRYLSSSCMACHEIDSLPGAERLRAGRQLFESNGCRICHQVNGTGGNLGPVLDGVGLRREPEWLIRHFKKPARVSPGSFMPPVELSEADLEALTLYVLGFIDPVSAPEFLFRRYLPTPESGRDLYFRRGCIGCHALGGLGGKGGPDLTRPEARKTDYGLDLILQQPHQISPEIQLPAPLLPPGERAAMLAFLRELGDPDFVHEAIRPNRDAGDE